MNSEADLQPGTTESSPTGNPQQFSQSNLQPQAQSDLQPTSNQSIDAIRALDQGNSVVQLSTISNTTTATVQQAPQTQPANSKLYVYGAVGIICAALLAYMTYNLLKPRS